MAKLRVIIFITTLIVVGIFGTFSVYYARGYRFNFKTFKFQPNGILVIKSEPDGASVYINGELKTATNATISMTPGVYDVEVKKEGFSSWYKRLEIDKEIVTQAEVSLFKSAPSLSPITFSGATNPVMSEDQGKIAYADSTGLWVIDITGLPLGFSRDPKKITDGDLRQTSFQFSPDGRQILLTTTTGAIYELDASSMTPQSQRINVASKKQQIITTWNAQRKTKEDSLLGSLPAGISEIFQNDIEKMVFSPNQDFILYTASVSSTIPENLVRPLPGASTQKQERTLKSNHMYVYDIKEDRNFLVSDKQLSFNFEAQGKNQTIGWTTDSKHLIEVEQGKVTIADYDGTNKQTVYSGAFVNPYAFPYVNLSKLLILTNLGSSDSTPNLYSLTIK